MRQIRLCACLIACCLSWCLTSVVAVAAPSVAVQVASENQDLVADVQTASILLSSLQTEEPTPRDMVSSALADYRRIVETLYAYGHYSGVVSIRLNGREAATMSLLSLPAQITSVEVTVDPGPPFRFGEARIAPLPPGATPPSEFATGNPARATIIRQTSQSAVGSWRDAGYAKAEPGDQRIAANHDLQLLDADLTVIPGPQVRFGDLIILGDSKVRRSAIERIAGFPAGEQFSPDELSDVTSRLRRTGTFASVSVKEGAVDPDGTMDVEMTVVDRKPRRFGAGAELSSFEGLDLTAFWMHRNLFGGAERLRVEAFVEQIGAQNNGVDYGIGARLEFPSLIRPDTSVFLGTRLESIDDPQFQSDLFEIGGGVTWRPRDGFEAEAALGYHWSDTTDSFGQRNFRYFALPLMATWDNRDNELDARSGSYFRVEATPYVGVSGTKSGARLYADARAYRSLNVGRTVLAGRVQLGSILGTSLNETYPDFLFYSGGGGSVRGQPYQSLGITLPNGDTVGGRSYAGTMLEVRTMFTEALGGVIFADAGFIGSDSFGGAQNDWHAGAGIGVRYATPVGPLRFDIAAPIEGDTGDGVQLYIGIGQAF